MEIQMKTLSALLVGAFMVVGATSVIALEGGASSDDPMSAISAVRQQVQEMRSEDGKNQCFSAPVSLDGQGLSLENTCLKTDSGYNGTANYEFPEIRNIQN